MSFLDFNRRAAIARVSLFGSKLTHQGSTIIGCVSGISSKKQLEEGGFKLYHQCVIRVPRGTLAFSLGDRITDQRTGKDYRIQEIVDHPTNPEWKLGVDEL
jgi:hypothetical protein